MHPFSTLTIGIFVAGYITARWDLVTRLYELAIFAWEYGVLVRLAHGGASRTALTCCQTRAAKGFAVLTVLFLSISIPVISLARKVTDLVRPHRSR